MANQLNEISTTPVRVNLKWTSLQSVMRRKNYPLPNPFSDFVNRINYERWKTKSNFICDQTKNIKFMVNKER